MNRRTLEAGGSSAGGGGRRVCHGAPATSAPVDHASRASWGRTVRLPWHGGPRPPEAAASPRTSARVPPAVDAAARRGEPDGQARGRAADRVVDGLRPARAATTCRPRAWDGQRVAAVIPPADGEVVPAGTAIAAMRLSGVSAVTVPTAGAVRESAATRFPCGDSRAGGSASPGDGGLGPPATRGTRCWACARTGT